MTCSTSGSRRPPRSRLTGTTRSTCCSWTAGTASGACSPTRAGFGPHLTDRGIVCFDDYTAYKSVRRGADLACTELGLVRYGTVAAQLWAGRPGGAPAGVVRALRVERLVAAARRLSLRS